MKYLFTVLMVMFFFNQFAQKKKDEPKPQVITLKIDSIIKDLKVIYLEQVEKIDSLIQKTNKKDKPPTSTIDIQDSEELKLTTTSIGKSQWSITNFGGYSELYPEEQDQIRDFLKYNKFIECSDKESWADQFDNEKPAYYILSEPCYKLGFYFNKFAIKELEVLLETIGWKIADYTDFKALYEHVAKRNLKSYSPFNLIVGNPTNDKLKSICFWKGHTVYDIYGLNIFPYSSFTGYDIDLKNEVNVEYFSKFTDDNAIQITFLTPNGKLPIELKYESDNVSGFGFFIRLIKK